MNRKRSRARALVLGGGIQGCCASLALLRKGYRVTLLEQGAELCGRASFNQEGKIHLGFVYGLDPSLATGRRMVHDGLRFSDSLEALLERRIDWSEFTSKPFTYLVARDSMLSVDETEAFFRRLAAIRDEIEMDPAVHYLGGRGQDFFSRVEIPPEVNPDCFSAAYRTMEKAVDQAGVRQLIATALGSHPDFELRFHSEVLTVERTRGDEVRVEWRDLRSGEVGTDAAELVVNCTWESRDRIDVQMVPPNAERVPPNLRIKCGLLVQKDPALAQLDSFTIVHGAYGDFVNFPGKETDYFCWYPVSMKGMVCDFEIPADWRSWLSEGLPAELSDQLRRDNEENFRRLIPALTRFHPRLIKAGIIVARGRRDIHFRESGLHQRAEEAVLREGNYWSINTGKFTSGPANAWRFLDALRGA